MVTRARKFLSARRWPIFVGGILSMSLTANAVLVWVATRPDSPRPIEDYYRRSQAWDSDSALRDSSGQLGWDLRVDVPSGAQYSVMQRRPVDLRITDRDGRPVTGLSGRLVSRRPSDARLDDSADLTELPHQPGQYRTLARLDAPGLWELSVDARRGDTRFVHTSRVMIDSKGGR